jgi:hypothetical protein
MPSNNKSKVGSSSKDIKIDSKTDSKIDPLENIKLLKKKRMLEKLQTQETNESESVFISKNKSSVPAKTQPKQSSRQQNKAPVKPSNNVILKKSNKTQEKAPKIDRAMATRLQIIKSKGTNHTKTAKHKPNRTKIRSAVLTKPIKLDAETLHDTRKNRRQQTMNDNDSQDQESDKEILNKQLYDSETDKKPSKQVAQKTNVKSQKNIEKTVFDSPIEDDGNDNTKLELKQEKTVDTSVLKSKILSNKTVNNEKKIITNIRFEKDSENKGVRVFFDLDPSAIRQPCYTINYKTDRERMLATVSKIDKKISITRLIEYKYITTDEITFGIVDLYMNDEPTWVQEIKILLDLDNLV